LTNVTNVRRASSRRLRAALPPAVLDGLLAAGLTALVLASAVHPQPGFRSGGPLGLALGVLLAAPLAWRRTYPQAVLAATLASFAAASLLGFGAASSVGPVGSLVALYTLALHLPPRRSVAGLGVAQIVAVVAAVAQSSYSGEPVWVELIVTVLGLVAAAWGIGIAHRRLRDNAHRLQVLTDQLRAEQQANARHAVLEERARIARELHDVVAHHISVIAVQTNAVRALLHTSTADADAGLRFIHATSRDALGEMRRLIGILQRNRDGQATDQLAPQPSIAQVDTLVEHANQAGLPTELIIEGRPRPLPAGLDLSAYRIVQEALTNAMKHAGPAHAIVTIRYTSDRVDLEVVDDGTGNGNGRPAQPPPPARGHGLLGMRERVALFDGEFHAGPRPTGGFHVIASLPARAHTGEPQASRA
jgi:signal transduction histidine kinase